jgi:hypothetical protein
MLPLLSTTYYVRELVEEGVDYLVKCLVLSLHTT